MINGGKSEGMSQLCKHLVGRRSRESRDGTGRQATTTQVGVAPVLNVTIPCTARTSRTSQCRRLFLLTLPPRSFLPLGFDRSCSRIVFERMRNTGWRWIDTAIVILFTNTKQSKKLIHLSFIVSRWTFETNIGALC